MIVCSMDGNWELLIRKYEKNTKITNILNIRRHFVVRLFPVDWLAVTHNLNVFAIVITANWVCVWQNKLIDWLIDWLITKPRI